MSACVFRGDARPHKAANWIATGVEFSAVLASGNDDDQEGETSTLETKQELAEHYKVSRRTISYWMSRKTIPYVRIGNVVRFDLAKVDEALAAYTVKPTGLKSKETVGGNQS